MDKSKETGKTLTHTKDQTPLSGNLQEYLEVSPCPAFSHSTRRRRHRSVRGTSILQCVALTTLSMWISSMCPTTACSVGKDESTVTSTNRSLTLTTSRVSGGISMLSRAQQVSFFPSLCWGHTETLYDVWLLSFVAQDRISSVDRTVNFRWQITTDIGSWQNKVGNAGLAPDACDPEQRCNWQDRGITFWHRMSRWGLL